MVELPRRTRSDECITDLAFDHLIANELAPDARAGLEQHLASCQRCQARRAELEQEASTFLASAPTFTPRARPAKVSELRPRRVVPMIAAGLAIAASALLVLRPSDDALDTTRSKGSARLGFFIKRGEQVIEGHDGARVRPGDVLRFTYTTQQPSHVAVLSVDGAGVASVYFPEGAATRELPAGRAEPLPDAIELDATLGQESLFGLFCSGPLELQALRRQLEKAGPRAFSPPEHCQAQRLTIVKERAP
jgi:hypothetical protein